MREKMTSQHTADEALSAPLRTPDGDFAMVALDQRESLRRMFPANGEVGASDRDLRDFKALATRVLTPHASAVLLDRPYAVTSARPAEIADGCALILAADVLEQPPGQGVLNTTFDRAVTPDFIRRVGAAAIKLLVIWRPGRDQELRRDLVGEFVAVAERAGVASLVEGIVRPAEGEEWSSSSARHQAILEAAAELTSYGGTIYKAEVPGYLPGDVSRVRDHAARLTEIVAGPWVVLSNGVLQEDFAAAVGEATAGGAQGFLAGRAIWADTVPEPDPEQALRSRSVDRLGTLIGIVSRTRRS
jgi:sulfofructosephosphate aldolase